MIISNNLPMSKFYLKFIRSFSIYDARNTTHSYGIFAHMLLLKKTCHIGKYTVPIPWILVMGDVKKQRVVKSSIIPSSFRLQTNANGVGLKLLDGDISEAWGRFALIIRDIVLFKRISMAGERVKWRDPGI